MKILFISHTYPPILGGIENQNQAIAEGLKKIADVKIIANGKGKKWLPIFLPITFLKAFFLMTRYDTCLLGSGVLAPIGAVLGMFHPRKSFFCIIHGLDITYANKNGYLASLYKKINIPSLKKVDQIFAVSNSTIEEAVKIGIEKSSCHFVPNGVNSEELKANYKRADLERLFGKNLKNKKVILRLGRFVPHKGTSWFIKEVMPSLPDNIVMIAAGSRVGGKTAGDKDDFHRCEEAVLNNQLKDRVKLMPSIPREEVRILLNTVDLVVSPNIKVPGTMEGFGLNVIEAGACGRTVLASNLEGLSDAIKNEDNGFLIEAENKEAWVNKINSILDFDSIFIEKFGEKTAQFIEKNYNWRIICKNYLKKMRQVHDEKRIKVLKKDQ